MTDQWQRDMISGQKRVTAMGSLVIFVWSATLSLPALGQDEKHYHEESRANPIDAVPGASKGWRSMVARLNGIARSGPVDVYFLGDSLTQFWQNQGQAVWALDYAPLNAGNFGIAADRVENILWRLQNGNLGGLQPKAFVLMMGTNNLAATPADPPAKVVSGIVQVLNFIKKKRPSAKILLVSILPNGDAPQSDLRENIAETNRLLAATCDGLAWVEFVDAHNSFVDSEGRWKPGLTLDGTHLTAKGYDVLSNRLRPALGKALKSQPIDKKAP